MRRFHAIFPGPPLSKRLLQMPLLSLGLFFLPNVFFGSSGIWPGYAGGPQHQAISHYRAQTLQRIVWTAPVDMQPQFSGNDLLIHYGSPMVSAHNTVVVPVKTGSTDGFRVDGYRGTDGLRLWSMTTDYTLPPHTWTPSFSPTIVFPSQLAVPGAGGTLYLRSNVDASIATQRQFCFFGLTKYRQNRNWCNLNVQISTPITTDSAGNMWFGFRVDATPPSTMPPLHSGLARVTPTGQGTWISAGNLAGGDNTFIAVPLNSAPALSLDGSTVYTSVKKSGYGGMLVAADSKTLLPIASSTLIDPKTSLDARLDDASTASPTVGPDGDVFYGILENPFASNNDRGWLLHFDSALNPKGVPGAFGWDDTVSIVPSYAVPTYGGTSSYLICTKYNNYGDFGTGLNKLAVLDPNDSFIEPVSNISCMNEVLTVLGVTPDPNFPNLPGAVREWCINTAAIDPYSRCAIVNSEDGHCYRWDFLTNALTDDVQLTAGIGEAYTPTVIGMNGMAFAINDATVFALSSNPAP